MTTRAAHWVLLGAFATTLPLPFVLAEPELAPWLRLAFLTAVMLAVVAADGWGGTTSLFPVLLVPQLLVGAALVWLLAALAARALGRVGARARAAFVALAVAGLLVTSLLGIYRTPHSSSGPTATLLEIFD